MFAPEDETVEVVKAWLIDSGIAGERISQSDNKAWIAFDATTEEAEGLLHTTYHGYEHLSSGGLTLACDR